VDVASFEEIQRIDKLKADVKSTVEKDGRNNAIRRLNAIKRKRGGKFKLSEAQFMEEMENAWICGEFSSSERVLRCIELDDGLDTKDMIVGEVHLFINDLYQILKKRLGLLPDLDVDDLIFGKYSSRKIAEDLKKESAQ
jgi:hypothetical protein